VFNVDTGHFTVANLLALARAAEPVCDTTLTVLPLTAGELGPYWNAISILTYQSGVRPQCVAFQDDRANLVIVVGGLGSAPDFQRAFLGSLDPGPMPKLAGRFNAYAVEWANQADAWVQSLPLQSWQTVVFVGHSMGGAVAPMLARMLFDRQNALRVSVFTMGAPRFCDFSAARALSFLPIYRLMNYGDITPAVPPRFNDAPLVYPLLTPHQISSWSQLVHVNGGIAVESTGAFVPQELPLGYSSPLMTDYRTGWQAYQAQGLPSHEVSQYVERLEAQLPSSAGAMVKPAVPNPFVETPLRSHQIEALQENARQYLRQMGAQQTFVPPSAANTWIRIRRMGGRWFVFSGDVMIYTATSKRDAVGVAKATRAFARQLLQQPALFSNLDGLVEQLLEAQQ
jgi:pimeloyl-ACP methyl ester carboxylesterase